MILSLFSIFMVCSLWIFYINFSLETFTKILFVLISVLFFGISLNLVPKMSISFLTS